MGQLGHAAGGEGQRMRATRMASWAMAMALSGLALLLRLGSAGAQAIDERLWTRYFS
jgi:hypothetical protein